MCPILKYSTPATTKLMTGAPSQNASPRFNDAEQNSANDYEDVGMTSSHSEDESDAESGHEEPGHNQCTVPWKGGEAPLQQNDIDDDGDEDIIATGLPMPMDDVPEAVLQETLAALQHLL